MKPIVSYDLMYSCAALLVVLVLVIWGLYELHQRRNRYRDVLPAPRCDLVRKGGRDHWEVRLLP